MVDCCFLRLQVFISAVISRTMEKQKLKASVLRHSFSWVYSPATKELFVTEAVAPQKRAEGDEKNDEGEEFLSVKSCFSRCSSSPSGSAFYSVKTNLSRCSSFNDLHQSKHWRRSVIEEFCHCEGWPFGLCRRAVLLPPLPKSPSESWLSRKMQPSTKKPWISSPASSVTLCFLLFHLQRVINIGIPKHI